MLVGQNGLPRYKREYAFKQSFLIFSETIGLMERSSMLGYFVPFW